MLDIQWNPERRFLRQFAAMFVVFFGLIGSLQYFVRGATTTGIVLWSIGAVLGGAALASPWIARHLYIGWMCVLYPFAWVISHALLISIYYLVFTPIGLLMRLCGRDPLQRRFDRQATTYWKARTPPPAVERYFRQF